MRWHRIHYTYGWEQEAEGLIDVLSEDRWRALCCWDLFVGVRAKHPSMNCLNPMTVTYIGDGDGSEAAGFDPRDEDSSSSARFELHGD